TVGRHIHTFAKMGIIPDGANYSSTLAIDTEELDLFGRQSPGPPSSPPLNSSIFLLHSVPFAIPLGVVLTTLSLLTCMGNAMVVHAIRTERKLHTVRIFIGMEISVFGQLYHIA